MDRYTGLRQRAKRLWFIYIASLDLTLTVLFVLCGLVIIAHDVFFAGWPELLSGGAMLWEWLYRLCFAFAASYIFYVVVVHVKRQRDKENVRDFLGKKTDQICEDARKLIGGLRGGNVMKYERHYYPSYEEVKSLCEHINLEAAPIGEYRMCQGEAEGLPNSSEHCQVQKVASLLAQALRRSSASHL